MARSVQGPPKGVIWLASSLLVLGTLRVVFGVAAAASGAPVGAVAAAVGAVMLVEATGLAGAKPWGFRLAIVLHGLDGVAAAAFPLLVPSTVLTRVAVAGFAVYVPSTVVVAVALAVVDLVVLGYLVANHRHFRPLPVADDPMPTERTGRFEDRWDRPK